MSMYRGTVRAPNGVEGEILVSVPTKIERAVTGWIIMGAEPNHAMAGFSGMRVGGEILASGRNRRGQQKVFDLEVDIVAALEQDGKSVVGEVTALLNVPEAVRLEDPEGLAALAQIWPFRATLYAGPPLKRPPGVGQEFVFDPEEVEPVTAGYWRMIPGWVKGGAAAIAAAFVARAAYKKVKKKR